MIVSHVAFTRRDSAHRCKTDPKLRRIDASDHECSLVQGAAAMVSGARVRSAGPIVMKSEGLDRTGSGSQAPAVFQCPMPGSFTTCYLPVPTCIKIWPTTPIFSQLNLAPRHTLLHRHSYTFCANVMPVLLHPAGCTRTFAELWK